MKLESEFVWLLLSPSNVVFLFLLLSLLALLLKWYKFATSVLLITLIFAIAPSILPIKDILYQNLEKRLKKPIVMPANVDGILVLGGSLDWNVSNARAQLNTNEHGERLLAAAALAKKYPTAKLVFTGMYREDVINDFKTIPNDDSLIFGNEYSGREVVFLGKSRSTYEDMLQAIETIKPQRGQRWILVTSAAHLARAHLTAKALGWTLIPYPVDYQTSGKLKLKPDLKILKNLTELDPIFREWGAIFVYKKLGRTKQLLP